MDVAYGEKRILERVLYRRQVDPAGQILLSSWGYCGQEDCQQHQSGVKGWSLVSIMRGIEAVRPFLL